MSSARRLPPESFPESSTTRRILSDLSASEDEGSGGAEHGELWLVSYADLMTLLFGFFVMLYADAGRVQDLKSTFETITEAPKTPSADQTSEIVISALKEQVSELESKLSLAQSELSKKKSTPEPKAWSKQKIAEQSRLLFKMPCRFCANFSNSIDSGVAGKLQAFPTEVVISHVTRGGPADLAGIHSGDIIESINGRHPTERNLFESFPIGEEVAVALRRFGQKMTLTVSLDAINPEALSALKAVPAEDTLAVGDFGVSGIGPRERITYYIPSEIEGALVTKTCQRCGSFTDRLNVGDVIVAINGEWIRSPEELSQIWIGNAVVEVWRKGSRSYDLVVLSPGSGHES